MAYRARPHDSNIAKRWVPNIIGVVAFLLTPILIPIVLIIIFLQKIGLLKSTTDRTADEVATYLDNEIHDRSGGYDWDDFISVPITDPFLDGIRAMASDVDYPPDDNGREELRALLREVRGVGL